MKNNVTNVTIEEVKTAVEEMGYTAEIISQNKINGRVKAVVLKNEALSPSLSEDKLTGFATVQEAANTLVEAVRNVPDIPDVKGILTDIFNDYEKMKPRLRATIVNYGRNKDNGYAMKAYLDLGIIAYVDVSDVQEGGNVKILESHIEKFGMTTDEVIADAIANSRNYEKCSLFNMISGLTAKNGQIPSEEEDNDDPIQVVTNKDRLYGATVLADPETLAEYFKEDTYILPSSIHEVITVPVGMGKIEDLASMVESVNASTVDARDYLSDNVYLYSAETGKVTIAA